MHLPYLNFLAIMNFASFLFIKLMEKSTSYVLH